MSFEMAISIIHIQNYSRFYWSVQAVSKAGNNIEICHK